MPSSQRCLAARTMGEKGLWGTGTRAFGGAAPASAPLPSKSSSSPICLQVQQLLAYLRAHLPKVLQEEVLALQKLPHHGLSTGKVPILAGRKKRQLESAPDREQVGAQANLTHQKPGL